MVEFEQMKSDPRLEMARIRTQSSFEEIMYFEEKEENSDQQSLLNQSPPSQLPVPLIKESMLDSAQKENDFGQANRQLLGRLALESKQKQQQFKVFSPTRVLEQFKKEGSSIDEDILSFDEDISKIKLEACLSGSDISADDTEITPKNAFDDILLEKHHSLQSKRLQSTPPHRGETQSYRNLTRLDTQGEVVAKEVTRQISAVLMPLKSKRHMTSMVSGVSKKPKLPCQASSLTLLPFHRISTY